MNLDDLGSPAFWRDHSDNESCSTPLAVVLPSGRAAINTSGHLALASDAIYTHEVVLEIDRLSREAHLTGVAVQSLLDIDFYEYLHATKDALQRRRSSPHANADRCLYSNLLVIATADINTIALELLTAVRSTQDYHIGCTSPYENPVFKGGRGHLYTYTGDPNTGVLALYPNPWCSDSDRIALLCGGLKASGTMAATSLLLNYLRGICHGNNAHKPAIPVRIVDCRKRTYSHIKLLAEDQCVPQHDVRGIEEELHICE